MPALLIGSGSLLARFPVRIRVALFLSRSIPTSGDASSRVESAVLAAGVGDDRDILGLLQFLANRADGPFGNAQIGCQGPVAQLRIIAKPVLDEFSCDCHGYLVSWVVVDLLSGLFEPKDCGRRATAIAPHLRRRCV